MSDEAAQTDGQPGDARPSAARKWGGFFAGSADGRAAALAEVRKQVSGKALDLGLRGVSRIAALHPRANPERYGIEILRDIAYGPGGADHTLDVYRPRVEPGVADKAPILYLHGGGFRILSKETHWGMALALAHRGHVVFVPNYRLAPGSRFPAAAEDACRVTQWVLDHAAEHGADTRRLILAGESAGANLSLVVTIARSWERPEPWARDLFERRFDLVGVLPACGFLQVSDPGHRGTRGWMRDRMIQISGDYLGPAARDPRELELADVISFLELAPRPAVPLPPVFAICGGADPVLGDTERLTPAWRALGGQADHRVYPRGVHAFHAFLWTRAARAAWADQHAFIDKVLGLSE